MSMAKFAAEEVRNLQAGGNEVTVNCKLKLGKVVLRGEFECLLTWG